MRDTMWRVETHDLSLEEMAEACVWCREHTPSAFDLERHEDFVERNLKNFREFGLSTTNAASRMPFYFADLVEATHFKLRWG